MPCSPGATCAPGWEECARCLSGEGSPWEAAPASRCLRASSGACPTSKHRDPGPCPSDQWKLCQCLKKHWSARVWRGLVCQGKEGGGHGLGPPPPAPSPRGPGCLRTWTVETAAIIQVFTRSTIMQAVRTGLKGELWGCLWSWILEATDLQ